MRSAIVLFALAVACGPRTIAARSEPVVVPGLAAGVTVGFDERGVPTIEAGSRLDAIRGLGYVTARDRLFQMDLLRRRSAGRLAEILGAALVPADLRQRTYQLPAAARVILARLPADQRAALAAYAEGVNAYLAAAAPPVECERLGYRPEPWRAEDSVLVVLVMFQTLGDTEAQERARTIMTRTLPPSVVRFLIGDVDPYTRALLGAEAPATPPLPIAELAALTRGRAPRAVRVNSEAAAPGSNAWAVAGTRTRDGRAILANDMHLDLGVPNLWYRAGLRYQDSAVDGVVLPGVPLVVAGSNRHVAWGLTNLEADAMDLVELALDPRRPDEYRTPSGWRRFDTEVEHIAVRGEAPREVTVRRTIWGPVTEPLLGRPVAVRWAALDPAAVDLGLADLESARSIDEAIAALNRAGAPACNAILADRAGRVAWTVTGRMPRRHGFDGAVSVSWSDGRAGWNGYRTPAELPRLVDPPAGFVVNANHRMPGPRFGHDFANGYRAYRITERLRATPTVTEADLFRLQLDTRSEPFESYRAIALDALDEAAIADHPERAAARRALVAWDGHADRDSIGLALLARFRRTLIDLLFAAWLHPCRAADPAFAFTLADADTPVLRVVRERPPALVPPSATSWDDVVLAALDRALAELGSPADRVVWGAVNRVEIAHPLRAPELGMLDEPLAGCGFCVRLAAHTLGASERLVVAPGREREGILHMPGGQSGDPRSPHYRDQQRAWVEGSPLPLLGTSTVHTLRLAPE